jgi:hypothetical protein
MPRELEKMDEEGYNKKRSDNLLIIRPFFRAPEAGLEPATL